MFPGFAGLYKTKMAHLLHVCVVAVASVLPMYTLVPDLVNHCKVVVKTDCYASDYVYHCQERCFDSLTNALGYVQLCDCRAVEVDLKSSVVLQSGHNNTVDNLRINSFTLRGYKNSTVQCHGKEAGITFSGVEMNVTVTDIMFLNCSVYGTLQFMNHHPLIQILNVELNRSSLVFINVSGQVIMNNSNITNVHSLSTSSSPVTGLYINSSLLEGNPHLWFNLNSCHFTNNNAGLNKTGGLPTLGAGMRISLKEARNLNQIEITNCFFADNTALVGGALSVQANIQTSTTITIHNSTFHHNNAQMGSAIDLYCSLSAVSPHQKDMCLKVLIKNTNFTYNTPLTGIVQASSSTVSTKNADLTMAGRVVFCNNTGSAITAYESDLFVLEEGDISFIGNKAQQGAGLNLIKSYFTIDMNTTLLFYCNRAIISGGAIYSDQMQDLIVPYSHHCFIRYVDSHVNPNNWTTTLVFENNSALYGSSIFTVSVMPCLWKESVNSSMAEDINNVFCGWKNWQFMGNCTLEVGTPAKSFQLDEYVLDSVISGLPIPYHKLELAVFDELGHNVTSHTTFAMLALMETSSLIVAPNYNGSIVAFGEGPTTEEWYIQTVGERTITARVNITMQPCPPGFVYERSINDCVCTERLHSIIHCRPNREAFVEIAYCMSYLKENVSSSRELVYGRCIFATEQVTKNVSPFILLPRKVKQFCKLFNRTGLLCGNCINSLSVDVFSDTFKCIDCSSSPLDWLIYIIVESVPVFILFSFVTMLHVSLTSGPVNGYIFFSQVITVTLEVIVTKTSLEKTHIKHPILMTNLLMIPANIWSLDFFRVYKLFTERPICLGSGLRVMHVLALRYISAFYPLIFLIITYIMIELHARNCCCLVRLWKPLCIFISRFRQTWSIRTSVVDGFAAFILLSYVKIIRVSLLLTTSNTVYDKNDVAVRQVLHFDPTITYGSSEHSPFMAVGTLLLVTYGLFFPLLLIFYQFSFLQRCLHIMRLNRNGLRIFMDAFQGCYKDGKDNGPDRRYFAGLYFVFRLVVFSTYNAIWDNKDLYITLQSFMILFALLTAILRPYKKELYNCIDTFFFSLLGIVFGLHVYVLDMITDLSLPSKVIYTTYALEFIPFLYLLCYISVWCGKRVFKQNNCPTLSVYNMSTSWQYNDSTEDISLLASAREDIGYGAHLHRSRAQKRVTHSTPLRDSASNGSYSITN